MNRYVLMRDLREPKSLLESLVPENLRAYLISKIKTFLLFSLYRGEHVHPELNHLDQIAEQNEGKLFFFR